MTTAELKMTIIGMMPAMENSDEYVKTCKELYDWLTEDMEFVDQRKENVTKLEPVQ